uniref:adenylate cyclase n=1 Tax=Globodera rostochiensis TaxID=31243 RepID=A0A914I6Y5_GLORO
MTRSRWMVVVLVCRTVDGEEQPHAGAAQPAVANGSSGGGAGGGHNTLAEHARGHSSSPRRIPLFERASARWWNPQFASPTLETQYWKRSFPLLRDRFRSGLVYILISCLSWMCFLWLFNQAAGHHWLAAGLLILLCSLMLWFTASVHYQRFYLVLAFLCTFLLCLTTLLIFSSTEPFMGPLASMATSIQVILLVYTVIPLPLYLCILICGIYSLLFELLSSPQNSALHGTGMLRPGTKAALHFCIHLLGIHLYILTQVRQRKTFLKVGQSLLARKDLELETQFKDHMIQSVMPKKVADELLKETSELRRPSASFESHSNCRSSQGAESTAGLMGPNGRLSSGGVPNVRKFRPFTMNLMNHVSILFADIQGFTKMSSNKSADELVNLLNDLFGRFDYLCGRCNLEKISTLGDCYYCVAGCPEPVANHAGCCVEMGLAMIIAIRQFDLDRGQDVNMRVGIHTGKVMCGMVGTKRFKFDVFSNDVSFANEMESTGVAGRVHVSEATANFLDGQYILEEAAPHQGVKTYFIAGRSRELESASGQMLLNVSDSDSAREGGLVSGESVYKASFRKKLADKLRQIQTNTSLPPVSRGATTTTTSQHTQAGGGGFASSAVMSGAGGANNVSSCLRLRLLDRSLDGCGSFSTHSQLNNGGGSNSRGTPPPPAPPPLSIQQQLLLSEERPASEANNGGGKEGQQHNRQRGQQHRVADETRKSSSLQMLTHSDERATAAAAMENSVDEKQATRTNWTTPERIGGKISAQLANESSTNNSVRGSRSSGLQDVGSDAGQSTVSVAERLDTAISHHHNAASLTRFDTDNRDFDQRLAQVIHGSNGTFAKGFWIHQKSLNRWTLNFNQRDIENEYRAHFAACDSSERHSTTRNAANGLKKHKQLSAQLERSKSGSIRPVLLAAAGEKQQRSRRPRYRYSGVFIDIFVSALLFIICSFLFIIQPNIALSLPFLLFIAVASVFLAGVIVLIGLPLLSRRPILPCLHQWAPRHVVGALLISLPVGIALFNVTLCISTSPNGSLCISNRQFALRLLYSFTMLLALFAHCNFSQLGAWPKTCQAIAVAVIFLLSTWFCQQQLDNIRRLNDALMRNSGDGQPHLQQLQQQQQQQPSAVDPVALLALGQPVADVRQCNRTQPYWSAGQFGSPLFIWELVLDVALAVILVAFLNYQFEAGFRMSFFGDVQARRDTAKMQLVRDQADWLLTNIIPQHAVESLKTNTKYSENHKLTAVMFASITNWHEMYEENFEGGREFLRVLNEVIGDFDELLDRADFAHVEKIKTIGPCYMAASGLNPERRRLSLHPYEHLYQLMEFAIALQNALAFFNQDLLNFEFECKIGFNIGPVTAGVIGTTKLYYDIWGDTVNIASRMYSTGIKNRIQVSSYTRDLLIDRYDFEYRDRIQVKGVDGGMDTYLLVGRKGEGPLTFPFTNDR